MDNKVFSAMPLIYSQMEDKQKPIASSVKKIFKITVCYFFNNLIIFHSHDCKWTETFDFLAYLLSFKKKKSSSK